MAKDHPYDNPLLSPLDFLIAVYHDRTAPLPLRMQAADVAAKYVRDPRIIPPGDQYDGEVRVIIRIEGLGNNPPELVIPEMKAKTH